jgi:hypothetical protein
VNPRAALGAALLAGSGHAATAYVTDQLVLGVYVDQKTQGQRLATLHSGAAVDTLAAYGDSTQVRLADGIVGWVKTAYLTNVEPATLRVKELQDELDRIRATTPALAEAAERSEVNRLTRELALRETPGPAPAAGAAGTDGAHPAARPGLPVWGWLAAVAAVAAASGGGFWAGYATLARRVRRRFGGIKLF